MSHGRPGSHRALDVGGNMVTMHRRGPNATEIQDGGRSILFSYDTPVAVHVEGMGYYVTSKFWSRATSRHIKLFLGPVPTKVCGARIVPQEVIARMASGGSIATAAETHDHASS